MLDRLPSKRSFLGFTLVELLVVVSIVAVLAGVGVTRFSTARESAEDLKRKADIEAIAKAYEISFNPLTQKYRPLTANDFASRGFPIPPEGGSYSGLITTSTAKTYNICATLESGTQYCKASGQTPKPTSTPTNVPTATATRTPTQTPTITPTPTTDLRYLRADRLACVVYPGQSCDVTFTFKSPQGYYVGLTGERYEDKQNRVSGVEYTRMLRYRNGCSDVTLSAHWSDTWHNITSTRICVTESSSAPRATSTPSPTPTTDPCPSGTFPKTWAVRVSFPHNTIYVSCNPPPPDLVGTDQESPADYWTQPTGGASSYGTFYGMYRALRSSYKTITVQRHQ